MQIHALDISIVRVMHLRLELSYLAIWLSYKDIGKSNKLIDCNRLVYNEHDRLSIIDNNIM